MSLAISRGHAGDERGDADNHYTNGAGGFPRAARTRSCPYVLSERGKRQLGPPPLKRAVVTDMYRVLGCAGIAVSLYALYTEKQLAANPFYEPACVTKWGSCATVFSSDYAFLLSKWGLVARHGPLDFSLAFLGVVNYTLYFVIPTSWIRYLATASCCFSVYLLYVLKYILKDFCIVCTTFHLINFSMLLVTYFDRRRRPKLE